MWTNRSIVEPKFECHLVGDRKVMIGRGGRRHVAMKPLTVMVSNGLRDEGPDQDVRGLTVRVHVPKGNGIRLQVGIAYLRAPAPWRSSRRPIQGYIPRGQA